MKLRVHLFQFTSVNGHPLKTLHQLQGMMKNLRVRRGDWLVFPEMWPSGFRRENTDRQKIENAFCFLWMKRWAKAQGCYLVGSMLEMPGRQAFNSAYVMGPEGKLLTRYRKIHLFRLGEEHRHFSPGKDPVLLPTPAGKLGLGICYDLRFPELFRELSIQGADWFIIPSAWPKTRLSHFLTLLRARAIENQAFVVGCNKIGKHHSGIPYGGHSAVFSPWGECLGELSGKKGILSVPLDFNQLKKIREKFPFLKSRVLR